MKLTITLLAVILASPHPALGLSFSRPKKNYGGIGHQCFGVRWPGCRSELRCVWSVDRQMGDAAMKNGFLGADCSGPLSCRPGLECVIDNKYWNKHGSQRATCQNPPEYEDEPDQAMNDRLEAS
ncbi:hypothetical protein PT974_05623 [Cladobotryum mycophilum]|uniref:Uncharacterized protein n=1 Tax=Cladobotryum mycophilum TaxID=491253 RepID=A0ABR0SK37_9HYPO